MLDIEIPSFDFAGDDWKPRGACADLNAEEADGIFFPQRGNDGREARALCSRCPVKDACLEHALEMPEEFGIWGGTSARERQALRRDLKRSERMAS